MCHAYRNSTLSSRHVDVAFEALRAHAFFGLVEAFRTSAKLALRRFGVDDGSLDDVDLARRRSDGRLDACAPTARLRIDAGACRDTFRRNALDYLLYERAHRERRPARVDPRRHRCPESGLPRFCRRVRDSDLANDPETARLRGASRANV